MAIGTRGASKTSLGKVDLSCLHSLPHYVCIDYQANRRRYLLYWLVIEDYCTYACIFMHVSSCMYLYVCICMYVSVCMYLYVCICMYVSVCMYLYACICIYL
ncbi:hypothetical protein BDF14DRAFT_782603 [Spinellus fusiger]|nr:hypothetical protein BDF14DRAFT_782603 [Spinellus fusiger]